MNEYTKWIHWQNEGCLYNRMVVSNKKKQTSNTCSCTDNYPNHTHWRKPDKKNTYHMTQFIKNSRKCKKQSLATEHKLIVAWKLGLGGGNDYNMRRGNFSGW